MRPRLRAALYSVFLPPQVEVMEGVLKCPDTGREFPITKGIPNMLLSEEET